jgi:C-6 monooxygenase
LDRTEFCTVLDHAVDGQCTQQGLIDALVTVHERWLRRRPGYRSAQFLASLDGRQVLTIVRWGTESDFRAFETSPDNATVMADIQRTLDGLPGLTGTRVSRYRLWRDIGPAGS